MECPLSIAVLPLVHGIVDHGVDTEVGHGQPVEGQEHVGGVPGPHDGRVVEGVHEVDMVGQPAHTKYYCHSSKHFHDLKTQSLIMSVSMYWLCPYMSVNMF